MVLMGDGVDTVEIVMEYELVMAGTADCTRALAGREKRMTRRVKM